MPSKLVTAITRNQLCAQNVKLNESKGLYSTIFNDFKHMPSQVKVFSKAPCSRRI